MQTRQAARLLSRSLCVHKGVLRLQNILAMAASSRTAVNSLTLPSSACVSLSPNSASWRRTCNAGHAERVSLQVNAQPQAGGSYKAINTVEKNVFQGPVTTQGAKLGIPAAAAPISVVATEVETLPLDRLKTGYLKFKENYLKDPALVKQLAEGQQPPYMIIACADSRVDPCTVLSLAPGEAFVLRNIGNMVPSYSENTCSSASSAIEFAVLYLKVKHLVIMGHSRCGAIKALMGMKDDGSNRFSEFIEDWVVISKGASKKVKNLHQSADFPDQCTVCEKEVVNHSLWNCLSYPFVRDKMASGDLTLHGAYYDFVNNAFESWSLDVSSLSKSETVK